MELAHEDLAVRLMGLALEHPLMNAAGTCKSVDEVKQLSRASTSAIMVGSITLQERAGNSGNVYVAGPRFSLNSLGMPNPGAAYYEKHLPAMAALAHDADKPLLVSVAGFTPHEYGELAAVAFDGGADAVELNLGCPNVWQVEQQKPIFDFDPSTSGVTYPAGATTERQKPIACFDPPLVAEILRCVESRVGSEARVAVKISPFSDPFALGEVAGVIAHYEWVKAITTTNTFPNAFAYDDAGQPMISPGGGLAGMGGPALKPIGLGQVRQLRSLLPERIQIIGVGGVSHGRDVREYLRAGAAAVQIATAYLERYERVFSTLLAELIEATLG